ncbi:hypothetical protein MRB53_012744 [Persea americana]|uniref:Uncharacterized protein n=1 Tax=Persea americana TaxID=3435 RepID=A0ACC2LZW4_PERAE|nr:hypothetical protein MRB53_012744 [Persea americana]
MNYYLPSYTKKQLFKSLCLFLSGATLISLSLNHSYANMERLQAQAKLRRELLKEHFRKRFGSKSENE